MTAALTVLFLVWLLTPVFRFLPMLYLAVFYVVLSLPQAWGTAIWAAHTLVAPGLGYTIALASKRRWPAVGFAIMLGFFLWTPLGMGLMDIAELLHEIVSDTY